MNYISRVARTAALAAPLFLAGCSLKYSKITGPFDLHSFNMRQDDQITGTYYALDINFPGLGRSKTMLVFGYAKWSDGTREQKGIKHVKIVHGSKELVLAPEAKEMTAFSITTSGEGADYFSYRAGGQDRMVIASNGSLQEIRYPEALKQYPALKTRTFALKNGRFVAKK